MSKTLPTKALVVYTYIVQYKREHDGNSPSYRDIADALGYKGHATVQYYLNMLRDDGALVVGESGIEIGGKYNPPHEMGI